MSEVEEFYNEHRNEIEQIQRKEACATFGHDYEVITLHTVNRPDQVICSSCGQSWNIQKGSL